jgi:penicillin-binding protein 2
LNNYRQEFLLLVRDELDLPLLSRAVGGLYPPGSTAKPIAALAGMTEGVITTETEFLCRGYLHNPRAFRCWIYSRGGGSHGSLNVEGAIKNSCNVFFYNVGEQLGVPRERYWLEQFGFGQRPGTGLGEEKSGSVAKGVEAYDETSARLLAIGQGRFSATPLQCANAMATIARNGQYLSPRLALDVGPQQQRRRLDIPREYFEVVKQGMYEVCNEPDGTAYKPFHEGVFGEFGFRPLEVEVCGKTGTAEAPPQRVDSNENGRIDADDVIVRKGDMAWFGGFAPREEPRIAVVVVVEYVTEGGGSMYAAPIGREVIRLCSQYGYVE